MALIRVNGIEMYYEERGNPEGRPLIFIAGLSRDHTVWMEFLEQKALAPFRQIVFDNRGSGQSEQPVGPYALELLAQDVVCLMDHLELEKSCIIGHSMGGFIAEYFAAHYPKRIDKLMLLCTCAKQPERGSKELEKVWELSCQGVPFEKLVEGSLPTLYAPAFLTPERVEKLLSYIRNNPYPQQPHALHAQLELCMHHDATPFLSKIQAETLVVTGEEDLVMTPEVSKELADQIPHATYYEVQGVGHMIQTESPEKLAHLIGEFMG